MPPCCEKPHGIKKAMGKKNICFGVILSFFILTLLCFLPVLSPLFAEEKKPIKILTGFYPLKLHQLSLRDEQFHGDFYVWFKWKGPKKLPPFEIMNGDYQISGDMKRDLKGGYHYEAYRVKGTFFMKVNLKDYPFDSHTLEIQIENLELDRSSVIYVPDKQDVKKIMKVSQITGWVTKSVRMFERKHVFETNFGLVEDAPTSTYSQYVFQMNIARRIFSYVIKYTVPLFIIVLMAFLAFFFQPEATDARVGIVITSILSIIAFHITQVDALPEIGYLVAADHFFILSYFVCGLSLIEVVVVNFLISKGNSDSAIALDRRAKILMPLFYLAIFFSIMLAKLF